MTYSPQTKAPAEQQKSQPQTQLKVQGGLSDERESTAELAQLQSMMHSSPAHNHMRTMAQLMAKHASTQLTAAQFAATQLAATQSSTAQLIEQEKPNNTGLPDQLKSGIENLSGMSMDHVKVHYNSSQPAQLNAHAYAQGSDIHIAPGQEQHLPHEAWHVVQQAQGRVKPTMQMKADVQINDDIGLENEADVMGARALNQGNIQQVASDKSFASTQSSVNSSTTAQRAVKCFVDKTGKKHMETLAGTLNSCVEAAKKIVDDNPLLQGVDNRESGYLGAWTTCFGEYLDSGEIPNFFYARYGYAIETLATLFFKAEDHLGYKVETQETYGATRPDFVIRNGMNDVAWIDITSAASKGHIFNKQGGGWSTKPYVAEVLYNMPSPEDFTVSAKAQLTPEQMALLEKADKSRALRVAQFDTGMKQMSLYLANAYAAAYAKKGGGLTKGDVQDVTKNVCKAYLDKFVDGGVKPAGYKGVLASIDALDVNGEISTGLSWAKWAFGDAGDQSLGRSLLLSLGKPEE